MSFRNSIVMLLVLTWNMSAVCASDAYSGHRLFYDASERSALDASIGNASVEDIEPVVVRPKRSDVNVPALEQHTVLFNGFVVRHKQDGLSTAIKWVDGQSTSPSLWRSNFEKNYTHIVYRSGRRLVLKPGQTGAILLEKPPESK